MTDSPEDPDPPDIDEAGVDRAQIRALLALTPAERLRRMEDFIDSLQQIRPAASSAAVPSVEDVHRQSQIDDSPQNQR